MKELVILLMHLLTVVARVLGPGGTKALVAENLLLKRQLLVLTRSRARAPNLLPRDRILLGFWSLFIRRSRFRKVAVALRPATLLEFNQCLSIRKYRALFATARHGKPGPKGPSPELVRVIVEIKHRNPRFGCPRIAHIVARTFGAELDKDVVRRVLAKHYRPKPGDGGPSWRTFIGHMRDSLRSVLEFCCESIMLRTHYVLNVRELVIRRINGFRDKARSVHGMALRRIFTRVISGQCAPRDQSGDHDQFFKHDRWRTNLRTLDVVDTKAVAYESVSPAFVEHRTRSTRREFLNQNVPWNRVALERKHSEFRDDDRQARANNGLADSAPFETDGALTGEVVPLDEFRARYRCRGHCQLSIAA